MKTFSEFFEEPFWDSLPIPLFLITWVAVLPLRLLMMLVIVLFAPRYAVWQVIDIYKFRDEDDDDSSSGYGQV